VTTSAVSGVSDLAGGMRSLLSQIDDEVRRVSTLSQRVDDLVKELNGVREEQAARLLALDALRASVDDAGLTSFLDKAIRPRRARVPEVVPDRLTD
jgi:outer membrane murein-binding lipoprotein Lpp